jgi:hypothetical protein
VLSSSELHVYVTNKTAVTSSVMFPAILITLEQESLSCEQSKEEEIEAPGNGNGAEMKTSDFSYMS